MEIRQHRGGYVVLTGDLARLVDTPGFGGWVIDGQVVDPLDTLTPYPTYDDVPKRYRAKVEAQEFVKNHQNARGLIDLDPASLEAAIESRNASAETLLLKTLTFAVRYLYATVDD